MMMMMMMMMIKIKDEENMNLFWIESSLSLADRKILIDVILPNWYLSGRKYKSINSQQNPFPRHWYRLGIFPIMIK